MMRTHLSILPESLGLCPFLFLSCSVLFATGTIDNAQLSDGVSTRLESSSLEKSKSMLLFLFSLSRDKKTYTRNTMFTVLLNS